MAMLILDCPRCGERKMTHDFKSWTAYMEQGHRCELFLQCRHCNRSFVVLAAEGQGPGTVQSAFNESGTLNGKLKIETVIRPRGSLAAAPEHTPPEICNIFNEGAECLSIGCWNAAGSMFRKIVDEVSKAALPVEGEPDRHTRFNLKARLAWLFQHNLLPREVEGLADCIREDANDAVHNAPIGKAEADDLLDFTTELLERVYTLPGRLRVAEERRKARRAAS